MRRNDLSGRIFLIPYTTDQWCTSHCSPSKNYDMRKTSSIHEYIRRARNMPKEGVRWIKER